MKRLLTVIIVLVCVLSCGPTRYNSNYSYFSVDTAYPQSTVDSLLRVRSIIDRWPKTEFMGIYRGESSLITDRVYYKEINDTIAIVISVVEYEITDTCTVTFRVYNPSE